jgi:Histidine kinase-, DNA gyrase B-, and HSP90-like ATPase
MIRATKVTGRGSGMGLSICRGIVESHGGLIQAVSQRGSGTRFTVTLPAFARVGVAGREGGPMTSSDDGSQKSRVNISVERQIFVVPLFRVENVMKRLVCSRSTTYET